MYTATIHAYTFAAYLRGVMAVRGIAPSTLAASLGVSAQTVSRWRQGVTVPSDRMCAGALAGALELDAEEREHLEALRAAAGDVSRG